MKHVFVLICAVFFGMVAVHAQPAADPTEAIKQTALDYADGFYSGDDARMARAIHYDLNKATPRYVARTGHCGLAYNTYSQLIEATRTKAGALPDTARHIKVELILQEHDVAVVKVLSANFNDYLVMAKLNGEWKIINVLWNGGPGNRARLEGFKGEQELPDVERAVTAFELGLISSDVKRLEQSISPDFSRTFVITPAAPGAKQFLQRGKFSTITENTFAFIGKADETQRDYSIKALDVMDALAVARLESPAGFEYLQLYKAEGQWKIFSSLSVPNQGRTLAPLLPAIPGEPMPEFTLPMVNGGEFTLSKFKGKNVLLMFPRGWVNGGWCTYCPYQYLELTEMEKAQKIRKKYNLEIAFVMPYSKERVADWIDKFGNAMQTLEQLKNQPGAAGLQKEYSDWVKAHFPKKFDVEKGKPYTTIPVLVDADRKLSKQLKLFTEFWDNIQSEQNVASFFIIDEKGILRFRHIGQMTEDRPSVDYILDLVKMM